MARPRRLGYGEGSVYFDTSKGTWRGAITLDDKRRRRVSAPSRSEAVALLDALRHNVSEGLPVGDDTRLGPWIDWWTANVGAAKTAATAANDAWALRQLEPLRGARLRDLTVGDVERQLGHLAKRKSSKKSTRGGSTRPLGRSSLVRVRRALGEALDEAERRDMIGRNVARLARIPVHSASQRERRSLTPDEAMALIAAAEGTRWHALVVVGLYNGLRPGELTGLPWDALDFDEGTLTVRQSRKVTPDGIMTIGATKAKSDRVQRMPAVVVAALHAHKTWQARERLASLAWEDHGLVFANEVGRPVDPSNLRRAISDLCAVAGIEPVISPNEMRHSAASLLVDRGARLEEVADFLGHANVQMLARVYRHRIKPVVDLTAMQEGMYSSTSRG